MRLRNPADYRTVLWVGLAILLVAMQYARSDWVIYLSPISCYLAIACGVIAHNHNHRPTFRSRRLNNFFGHILTVFYGYPTLMWIPTHNLNHHRFVNRPGDATITWRHTNKHNLPRIGGSISTIPVPHVLNRSVGQKQRPASTTPLTTTKSTASIPTTSSSPSQAVTNSGRSSSVRTAGFT